MANAAANATVVHSHTWYTGLAGHLAALLYGIPHVLTAHSLEPMRPWKAEQLGGGYRVSSWVETTAVEAADAVIAVSSGMRDDVLQTYPALDPNRVHVVRNGIDTDVWYPVAAGGRTSRCWPSSASTRAGPIVAFVGRITRQKGVAHLVAAAHKFAPEVQLVLCAGAPDTPEIAAEVTSAVQELSARPHRRVLGARDAADRQDPRNTLGSNSFRVPVGVRAVGHREPRGDGVRDGGGGLRRRRHSRGGGRPADRAAGALRRRATRSSSRDGWPTRSTRWSPTRSGPASTAEAGRQRCIDEFSWAHIAEQTLEIYRKVSMRELATHERAEC